MSVGNGSHCGAEAQSSLRVMSAVLCCRENKPLVKRSRVFQLKKQTNKQNKNPYFFCKFAFLTLSRKVHWCLLL